MKNLTFLSNLSKNGTFLSGNRLEIVSIMWRKIATLFFVLTFAIGNIWGATEEFTNSDINASHTSATKTPITVSIAGSVSTSGQQFRFGSGKAMTVTSSDGNITRIDVETNSTETYISPLGNSISSGSWNKNTNTKYYWTGDAASVTLTPNSEIRITTVTVTYSTGGGGGGSSSGCAVYTIESRTSVSESGETPSGSSTSFVNTYTNNKNQMTSGNSMTLTLSGYEGKQIKSITMSMRSNGSSGAGNFSATAGSTTIASIATSAFNSADWNGEYTTSYTDVSIAMTNDSYTIGTSENVVLVISTTTNSLYCASFTICWEDGGSSGGGTNYTVNFNGGSGSSASASLTESDGSGVTLPTATSCNDEWSFAGWATASCNETTTAPALYAAGETYHPTADNETLYAVYKQGSGKYEKITSTPASIPGKYLIVYESSSTAGVALKNEVYQSYYMAADNVVIDANTIENPSSTIVWDVTYNSSKWHFKNGTDYLYNWLSGDYHELGHTTTSSGYTIAFEGGYAVFTFAESGGSNDEGAHFYHTVYKSTDEFKAEGSDGTTKNLFLYKLNPATYDSNPDCSSCSRPSGPNTSGVTTSAATLSWAAPASAPSSGYLVAYSTSSTVPSSDVTATGGGYTVVSTAAGVTTKDLTGLNAGTTYHWWVRSNCGGGDYSSWVEAESFTTKISVTKSIDGITTTAEYASPYTLPTNVSDACTEWQFLGWSTAPISKTTSTPSLVTQATASGTYYAVFQSIEGGTSTKKTINISEYATAHSWVNGTQYATISSTPITLSVSGGTNSGKYYTNNNTWRIYSSDAGVLTVSTTSGNILKVESNPSKAFTISGSTATFTALSQTEFRSFEITYGTGTSYYATTTSCCTEVTTPVVTVTPHETSAVFSWDHQASATRGYSLTIVGTSINNVAIAAGETSYTASGLSSATDYSYIFTAFGPTCDRAANGEFTTELGGINIAEWDTAAIYLDLGDAASAVATVENQNTQAVIKDNVADSLFFSKYYEAKGNVKLVALYNGTNHDIDLTNYRIKFGDNGKKKLSGSQAWAKTVYADSMARTIKSGQEIIFAAYQNNSADTSVIKCAKENPLSGWDSYVFVSNLNFNGNDAVALLNPQGNLIDIIGAGNKTTEDLGTSSSVGVVAAKEFMDDPGWYNPDGININTNDSNYALSTNRCLLVRKRTVKSGLNAVSRNGSDFITLGGTYGEWLGLQIPATDEDEGIQASCEGFDYVGSYDYNAYYANFDTIVKPIDIVSQRQDDGTYKITIHELDTMSCTNLRVTVVKNGTETVSGTWKVPIFVTTDKTTFNTDDKIFVDEGPDCATCDVVVLRRANLNVVTGGQNTVRNIEVYQNGTLIVPSGKTYNINQLVMRSKEDTVPRLDIQGNLEQSVSTFVFDKRIQATRWYKIALPYRCRIADVTFRNGDPAEYGSDWILQYYDGDNRASGNEGNNWKTYEGTHIEAGVGYNLAINDEILETGNHYAELRFPMTPNAHFAEPTDVTVPVVAYGAKRKVDGKDVTPNHKGWNIIGNPYMMDYTTGSVTTPLTVGLLVDSADTYRLDKTGGLRYVVALDQETGEYSQVAIGSGKKNMEPFMAYFVQIDGASDNQPLSVGFAKGQQVGRLIRRNYVEEDNHTIWIPFTLTNSESEEDETTLLISDKFTNGYDMMDDLVKLRGSYENFTKPILATRNDEAEVAFNALPDSTASKTGIPVNFYAGVSGQYTFALNSKYGIDEIKEAQLFDATTNSYYDLLTDNYTFTTEAGENTTRFRLFVTVDRNKVPTDNNQPTLADVALTTIGNTLLLSGLSEASDIYVYDMSGKLMQNAHANGNGEIWRTNVPATGVYFVRVNTANGQQTLRAVVK